MDPLLNSQISDYSNSFLEPPKSNLQYDNHQNTANRGKPIKIQFSMSEMASKNLNSVLTANNTFKFIAEKTELPSM
jgi:hypothetical protein